MKKKSARSLIQKLNITVQKKKEKGMSPDEYNT